MHKHTHRWRGHGYQGQSCPQSLNYCPSSVTFRCFVPFKNTFLSSTVLQCVDFLSPCCICLNWLVLIGGTFDSSMTTVFIMLLVRRENLYLSSSRSLALSICCQSVTSEFSKCPGTRWLRSKRPMLKGVSVVPRHGVPNQSWLGAPYRRTDGHYYHL